MPRFFN
jgi:hypothetical protein